MVTAPMDTMNQKKPAAGLQRVTSLRKPNFLI